MAVSASEPTQTPMDLVLGPIILVAMDSVLAPQTPELEDLLDSALVAIPNREVLVPIFPTMEGDSVLDPAQTTTPIIADSVLGPTTQTTTPSTMEVFL